MTTMLERFLQGTDWDLAGLKLKEANPMLIERSICTSKDEGDFIMVKVPDSKHPYREDKRVSAEHYIPKADIIGISFYTEAPEPKIVSPNGTKKGAIIKP